jgi:thymidylate synthase
MNTIDKAYQNLLQDILDNGREKRDRTGTGTISVFGRQIRHKMSEGFPLLTTKKMAWKTMVTELLWFLKGDTNIKYLVDNNCHIWDGDAYKNWKNKGRDFWEEQVDGIFTSELGEDEVDKISMEWFINKIKTDDEFAKKWGSLGKIYGHGWRNWNDSIDQISDLIKQLKTNPDSRRLLVSAWNPSDLPNMVLPPCHYGFQVYTRELSLGERTKILNTKENSNRNTFAEQEGFMSYVCDKHNIPTRAISLMWNQRSVDTFLGLPFNIASYGLLLEIIAKEVNMVPDELIGNLGDVHLYSNHIEQAKEQIGREYTPEERTELLKEVMGYENYHNVIKELMPFGGGLSEYYESYKIPYHTREPFELPKLNIKLHFKNEPSLTPEYWLTDDFELLNYQSHPAIKAPLSN